MTRGEMDRAMHEMLERAGRIAKDPLATRDATQLARCVAMLTLVVAQLREDAGL